MDNIFVSYRRSDSREFCSRMVADLSRFFGTDAVFFDQETTQPGTRWPDKIRKALNNAEVVLVVMGPKWLRARDKKGRQRIDIRDDWVREEVVTALSRKENGEKIEIIPILIGDTAMPDKQVLNKKIKGLSTLQALRIPDTGSDFDFDSLRGQLIRYGIQPKDLMPLIPPVVGKRARQLTEKQETRFFSKYDRWHIKKTPYKYAPGGFRRELHRIYDFTSFERAFEFMKEVTRKGILPYGHHPRWENNYKRVEVWLTTINLNYQLSNRDERLARIFEQVWREEFKSGLK